MYATDSANVRSAPDTGAAVAAVLSGGDQVTAGVTVDGWVPVHVGDVYGWTSAEYLAEGTAPAAAAPSESSGNWMTDLLPQVDPAGIATWVFERNGSWGASDGYTVWIDPDLPSDKRFSVMVHEFSHVLQVRVYGSLDGSVAGLSALVGGGATDVTANESTADCMALDARRHLGQLRLPETPCRQPLRRSWPASARDARLRPPRRAPRRCPPGG